MISRYNPCMFIAATIITCWAAVLFPPLAPVAGVMVFILASN